uniref:Uncharacterized protein n=1 Tax=Sphaeramia orbicularis TaxID=375764 RepID=A0A673CWD0_9TELE
RAVSGYLSTGGMTLRGPAAHLRKPPTWRRSGDESYWETLVSQGEVLPPYVRARSGAKNPSKPGFFLLQSEEGVGREFTSCRLQRRNKLNSVIWLQSK